MLKIFLIFMKVALIGFGGGAVMTSLYQIEFVKTGLIHPKEFIQMIAMSQATPGPIAAGLVTLIGYKLLGIAGIFIANIGTILPTLIIIIFFSDFLKRNKGNKIIEDMFKILRPITISLIFSIIIFFCNISIFNYANINSISDLTTNFNAWALFIVVVSAVCAIKYKFNPIYIIILSGLLGPLVL